VSESALVKVALCWLNAQPDCWGFKVHGGPHQMAGVPDIVGHVNGVALFAEAKSQRGKLSEIQKVVHKEIAKKGSPVLTFRTLAEFQYYVEHHLR
jgi:hypothetical protein